MQGIHVVADICLHLFASRGLMQTQVRFCAMIDPSMCFGMHTIPQKLQIESWRENYSMVTKALATQSTSATFTTTNPRTGRKYSAEGSKKLVVVYQPVPKISFGIYRYLSSVFL